MSQSLVVSRRTVSSISHPPVFFRARVLGRLFMQAVGIIDVHIRSANLLSRAADP
jgi:hypothetical protein